MNSLASYTLFDHLKIADGVMNAVFGWTGDEHQFVSLATRAGAVVHASDFFSNLAFFSNLPNSLNLDTADAREASTLETPARVPVAVPRAAKEEEEEEEQQQEEEAVHTVSFIMSGRQAFGGQEQMGFGTGRPSGVRGNFFAQCAPAARAAASGTHGAQCTYYKIRLDL